MVVRISSTHLALYCVNIAFLHILPSSVANRTLAMPMAIGLVEIMFIDDLHKYHNASLYTQYIIPQLHSFKFYSVLLTVLNFCLFQYIEFLKKKLRLCVGIVMHYGILL